MGTPGSFCCPVQGDAVHKFHRARHTKDSLFVRKEGFA